MSPRVLIYDVETLPHVLWNFGNKMEWMRPGQVIQPSRMICFGAKWLGEKKVILHAEWDDSHEEMAKHLWALFDEADIIVAYNGDRFDDKKAKALFEQYGLGRPSPYKTVDPFKVVKKHLDLPSYKLDEVLKFYGLARKIETSQELWVTILLDDLLALGSDGAVAAKKKMLRYQKQDVVVLEQLYLKIRPYLPAIPAHVNGPGKCDKCGSTNLQKRGYQLTLRGKYPRYQCQDCGSWGKESRAEDNSNTGGI